MSLVMMSKDGVKFSGIGCLAESLMGANGGNTKVSRVGGGGGRGGGDELGFLTLYAAGSIEHIAADVFENVEGAG